MQLRWVGDARDYVKWDCVYTEAGEDGYVYYAAMLRDKGWAKSIHPEVKKFFDAQKNLDNFRALFGDRIEINRDEYSKTASDEYFEKVCSRLAERRAKRQKLLVFVDPDTGIAPKSGSYDSHVKLNHLQKIWHHLGSGDKLLVYQHASRSSGWLDAARNRLDETEEFKGCVRCHQQKNVAKDVGFIILTKS